RFKSPREIEWSAPADWKEVGNPSRLRKATYQIPGTSEEAKAELSVTQIGGTVDMNVERWQGQFIERPEAKRTEQMVRGLSVTVVELEGTLRGSALMRPTQRSQEKPPNKPNYKLLAAIVGTYPLHFFKMTGPKETVESARGSFDSLVASIKPVAAKPESKLGRRKVGGATPRPSASSSASASAAPSVDTDHDH
ncbi:MAG: hypothetical protein AAGA56_24740, partial [Myxococcota bacterium]